MNFKENVLLYLKESNKSKIDKDYEEKRKIAAGCEADGSSVKTTKKKKTGLVIDGHEATVKTKCTGSEAAIKTKCSEASVECKKKTLKESILNFSEEKKIITEELIIEQEIEYIENNQLPKDEQKVMEEGFSGKKEITYIRSYTNDELVAEEIINESLILEPIKSVIEVGTSEFLANKKVRI